MKVTTYGTRGSIAVARRDKAQYGGNTTCIRVESSCLPDGQWLVLDAGTGIVPLSTDFLQSGGKELTVLFTHYHHDHTTGLPLTPFPYLGNVPLHLYGPKERGMGPREVYEVLMRAPFFPKDLKEVGAHIDSHEIEHPLSTVLVIHREGGRQVFTLEQFERLMAKGGQLPFGRNRKFAVSECRVVRMYRSHHPEQTISYRIEERPTGQVFVLLTDHENEDAFPQDFVKHMRGANLILQDTQYTREMYDDKKAGWGHGTPDYTARTVHRVGGQAVGTFHHNPESTDALCDTIVATLREELENLKCEAFAFGARDYMVVDVGDVAGSVAKADEAEAAEELEAARAVLARVAA